MAHSAGSAAERVLVSTGAITEDQLARAVAERFGLDHLDLQAYRVDPDAAKLVTPAAIKRYQAVPVSFAGDRTLLVAMSDPANVLAVDDIAVMTGYEVRPAVASPTDIDYVLDRIKDPNWGGGGAAAPVDLPEEAFETEAPPPQAPVYDLTPQTVAFGVGGEDSSVIELVQRVIGEAVDRGASDIHFEPQEDEMRVRYRVDGVLHEAATVPVVARPGGHLPHQDPRRPRHRRAAPPAGRPRLDPGGRQGDRPPRRHAARAVRREGRHAHPGLHQGADQHGAARHAPAGARALHQGLPAVPRRRARHRPDRLGQVDVALRGAQRAQHDRQAHHHDRGPGRVPARGPHPGAGQQQGGPHVRRRPALDDARRPRHHHGRRDPRPRDRADRDRVGPHRPPRALHAAHERRAGRRSPA